NSIPPFLEEGLRKVIYTAGVAAASVLALASAAPATLIASESFHTTNPHVAGTYDPISSSGRLMAQNHTSGVYGVTTAWSTAWNQTGDLRARTTSLNHSLAGLTLDGSAFSTDGANERSIFRKLDYTTSGVDPITSPTFAFSFLMSSPDGNRVGAMGL